jgi:DsbC/DsbD-like thiol-disulfide interchange protein
MVGAAPACARRKAQPQATAEHVAASLVSELAAIVPGGRWLMALRLVSDPGWHTYWQNPGDAGSPPAVEWTLPRGFRAGPILWPTPDRMAEPPLAVYGYTGEVLLLLEMQAPLDLRPGQTVALPAHVSWVVCRKVCMQGETELNSRLTVSGRDPVRNPRWGARLRSAYASLPQPMPQWRVSARTTRTGYALRITPPGGWRRPLAGVLFYPARAGVIEHAAAQPLTFNGGSYTLALAKSPYGSGPATRLAGLLVSASGWDSAGTIRAMDVDVSVATQPPTRNSGERK